MRPGLRLGQRRRSAGHRSINDATRANLYYLAADDVPENLPMLQNLHGPRAMHIPVNLTVQYDVLAPDLARNLSRPADHYRIVGFADCRYITHDGALDTQPAGEHYIAFYAQADAKQSVDAALRSKALVAVGRSRRINSRFPRRGRQCLPEHFRNSAHGRSHPIRLADVIICSAPLHRGLLRNLPDLNRTPALV